MCSLLIGYVDPVLHVTTPRFPQPHAWYGNGFPRVLCAQALLASDCPLCAFGGRSQPVPLPPVTVPQACTYQANWKRNKIRCGTKQCVSGSLSSGLPQYNQPWFPY